MSNFDERSLRTVIDKALREHHDCDLARRVRRELGRAGDSNTTNRNRQIAAKRAAVKSVSDWAFEHLTDHREGPDDTSSHGHQVRAEEAFERFRGDTGSIIGKRAFYDALRAEGFRLVKYDYSGRESQHGILTIVGTELLP